MVLDLKQVDLKQVRDEVADRVTRAAKELGSGAGSAARELGATAEQSLNTQIRKQTASAKRRLPRRGGPGRLTVLAGALAGAVTVYFFDPQQGRARRAQFIDWSGARLRRGWRALDPIRARISRRIAIKLIVRANRREAIALLRGPGGIALPRVVAVDEEIIVGVDLAVVVEITVRPAARAQRDVEVDLAVVVDVDLSVEVGVAAVGVHH